MEILSRRMRPKIVAANRTSRGGRRTSARRNPRAQIVGTTTVPSPVARARVAAAKPVPVVAPSPAATQPAADKIIVSNLPPDVNEAQVKVCLTRPPPEEAGCSTEPS